MKKLAVIFCFFMMGNLLLMAQNLTGEYYLQTEEGQVKVQLQTSGNQLQGVLFDESGARYTLQAQVEDGDAFGVMSNPSIGSAYFEAYEEDGELYFSLIPPGTDGQPDASKAQEFVLQRRGSEPASAGKSIPKQQPGGPLGGSGANPGDGEWAGTYSGVIENTASALTMRQAGSQINGDIDAGGYKYTLRGNASGNTAEGTAHDPQTGARMPFKAQKSSGAIDFTFTIQTYTGQTQQLALRFTEGSTTTGNAANATPGAGAGNYERDQRLIGYWTYTDSYTSGEYSFASQWKMQVNADGTYLYGSGRVIGGGPGISGDSGGGGDVTRGYWRTQNKVIYVSADGKNWQPYCNYITDGSSLLMKFGDGSKQMWKRQ